MLNRLQSLFNRLAGVSDHLDTSNGKGGMSYPPQSFVALEKPACWRRRARKLAPARTTQS